MLKKQENIKQSKLSRDRANKKLEAQKARNTDIEFIRKMAQPKQAEGYYNKV